MGQQDCGISIEFYLQQTQNPHLGDLMYYSFSRKCLVQGRIWRTSTWTNWILQKKDAAIVLRKVVVQMNLPSYKKS